MKSDLSTGINIHVQPDNLTDEHNDLVNTKMHFSGNYNGKKALYIKTPYT